MKKGIVLLLFICLLLPIGFGEEEDKNVTVLYADGSVEVMKQSELDALGSKISVSNLDSSSQIVSTAVNQPIYMTRSHYNEYYDDWRLEYIKVKDILSDIETELSGSTIKVAVIDTGVYKDHPDLQLASGWDFGNNDNDPNDVSGHGSHVAGIIGAKSTGNDVTGVAPNIEILPVKVFADDGSGGTGTLAQGIRYAIDQNVDVINMSLKYGTYDAVIHGLLNEAETNGIVVVAATSNESNLWTTGDDYNNTALMNGVTPNGVSVAFPAAHDTILAVGSISKNKIKDEVGISDFSNIAGQQTINSVLTNVDVDVVAPGDEIVSWSQHGEQITVVKSGTSMATPHVAGLAAILQDKYPNLTAAQIRAVIRDTSYDPPVILPDLEDLGASSRTSIIGQGLINVEEAMNYSPIHNIELDDIIFEFDHEESNYTVTVPYDTASITMNYEAIEGASVTLNSNASTPSEVLTLSSASQTFSLQGTFGTVTKSYNIQINKALPKLTTLTVNGVDLDKDNTNQSYLEATDQATLITEAPAGVSVTINGIEESTRSFDVTSTQNVLVNLTSDETPPRVSSYQIQLFKGSDAVRLDNIIFNGVTINVDGSTIGDNTRVHNLGKYSYGSSFTATATATNGGTITYSINGELYESSANFTGDCLPIPGQVSTLDIKVTYGDQYNTYHFKFEREHATLNSLTYTTMDIGDVSSFSHDLINNRIVTISNEEEKVRMGISAEYPVSMTYQVNTSAYDSNSTKDLLVGSNRVTAKAAFGTLGQPDYEEHYYEAVITRSGNADVKTLTYQAKNDTTNLDLYKDEVFSTSDTSYDITVSNKMTSLTFDVVPEYTETKYTAQLNGSNIDLAFNKVILGALSDGDHTLIIKNAYHAFEETGYKSKIYTYNIHVVSGLSLSEFYLKSDGVNQISFNEETLTYNVAVLSSSTNLFKAVKKDTSYGSMKWIVDGVESDYNGTEETLEFGKTYQLKIISPIASETKTYDINFTERTIDTNSKLSQLYISGQSTSPVFAADELVYTSQVANDISSVVVNATVTSQYASLTINGQAVTSYTKNLAVGSNPVIVVVTAEDGSETEYTVTITRAQTTQQTVDPTPSPSPSPSPAPSIPSAPSPVVPKDDVETVKNDDGTEKVVVEVSQSRVENDLKDDSLKIIQVQLKDKNAADVSLNQSTIQAIGDSDKALEIEFDHVVFNIPGSILNQLKIKETLKVTFANVDNDTGDMHVISDVFELDLYDGKDKLKFDVPIPIELSFDTTKVTNKNNLAVYFYDEENKKWIYAGGKLTDDNSISFEARHFSKYAVRENNITFDDIQSHWAKSAIEAIASREITSGVSKVEFAPDKTLTNAEFIVLLVKILGLPEYDGIIRYNNILEDAWYSTYINKAIGAGLIINTYPLNFDPNAPIKREEMASLLMASYFYYTQKDASKMLITAVEFADDEDQVSTHFRNVVRMTYQLQLIVGDNNNNFNPQSGATRAEAAVVIQKLLKLIDLL